MISAMRMIDIQSYEDITFKFHLDGMSSLHPMKQARVLCLKYSDRCVMVIDMGTVITNL